MCFKHFPIRLRLACGEAPCEICAWNLAEQLGVSHYLKVLRSAGLVLCQHWGGYAFYHKFTER